MTNFFREIVTLMSAQRSRIFRILVSKISKDGAQIQNFINNFLGKFTTLDDKVKVGTPFIRTR